MPIFCAFNVGSTDRVGNFAKNRVYSDLYAAREIDANRARCGCTTCSYTNPRSGSKNRVCRRTYDKISSKETWSAHIARAKTAGHIHECGGRYYSKGRVSEGGSTYKASDYYAVPFNDRSLEAVSCPCGANRQRVVTTHVVVNDPFIPLVGVVRRTPVVGVVRRTPVVGVVRRTPVFGVVRSPFGFM
jgi:hypothetical protein